MSLFLAEDKVADVYLVHEILDELRLTLIIQVAGNGEEALR